MKSILLILVLALTAQHVVGQTNPPKEKHDTLWISDTTRHLSFNSGTILPQYPGGAQEMNKFLTQHIQYPKEAREKKIQGTVMVQFDVDEQGRVDQVKAVQGIGGGCDEEAVRVIQSMPNFHPGTQNGKPVRTTMKIPIGFTLSN